MRARKDADFIISGGLWWNKDNVSHSLNLLIREGQQIQSGVYSKFGLKIFKDKTCKMEQYSWTNNLKDMLGGSPSLIKDGKKYIDKGKMENYILTSKQPRAAIGLNDTYIFLVTIDGRKPGKVGATIHELANTMLELGCTDAMAGDGGGTARIENRVGALNDPTENRASNNAITIKLA